MNVPPLKGYLILPDRCRFALTGPDSLRYLNGQVTNQIAGLDPAKTRYACVTNAKGQLEADVYITHWPDQDSYVVESAIALRETLLQRLDRYLIADDASWTDITEEWTTIHVLNTPVDVLQPLLVDDSLAPIRCFSTSRYGDPGFDLIIAPSRSQDLLDALRRLGIEPIAPTAVEILRIARGVPLWRKELKPGLLPPEARLQARAIDYQKGCYIGQEVISRIKRSGKTNRLLCLIGSDDPGSPSNRPAEGAALLTAPDESTGKTVGTLTSVTPPGAAEWLGLAFVKTAQAVPGQTLFARSGTAEDPACVPVQVRQYPTTPPPA